jgi:predicted amidohydrolase
MLSGMIDSLETDLVILPEMFNTGFVVNPAHLAEEMDGPTLQWMQEKSAKNGYVVTGSLIIRESGKYLNRLFWVRPDGSHEHYDKRHLFTMAGEDKRFSAGTSRMITGLNGWKVCPLICYDLRFPAWSKNRFIDNEYEYDLLIYIANWPEARSHAWSSLLVGRAIENQSYVVGVNRVGTDGNNIRYSGDSVIVDSQGYKVYAAPEGSEAIKTIELSCEDLENFRDKFRIGPDWDDIPISSIFAPSKK